MALLARLRSTDGATLHAHRYRPFVVAGKVVGQVERHLVDLLLSCAMPDGPVFEELGNGGGALGLCDRPSAADRSAAMAAATQHLIDNSVIKKFHGDLYPVCERWNAEPLCVVDRNAAPFFGATSAGVHLHCFVRTEGGVEVWMAQRALDKATFPGYWDPTVAGGHPSGLSLRENMLKEAAEEAGLAAAEAAQAHSTGVLSQMTAKDDGSCLKQSLYFVWELEVATGWEPRAADGEVAGFERWDMQRVEAEVREGELLRPAMRLVMADFLMRHGVITPDSEPDYVSIQRVMHQDRLVLGGE